MLIYVKVLDDGNVAELFRFKDKEDLKINNLSSDFFEITEEAQANRILNMPECFLYRNGVWEEKYKVELVSDKTIIESDGADFLSVFIGNVPPWCEYITLDVNGLEQQVSESDPLEITSNSEMMIYVRVNDPRVLCYDYLTLEARESV